MSKHKRQQHLSPQQVLDKAAEKLAFEHQQRLHQMTRAAVYGEANVSRRVLALWPVAVPVFSLMAITLVWQLTQQVETPSSESIVAMKKGVPHWVKDASAPLAVIENIEFYQWLEKELDHEHQS